MKSEAKTDLCIIGAGWGGLSLAAGAAQMGARVVLIERGKMGGDCLNYGCVPSKALLAAGQVAHQAQNGRDFGIRRSEATISYRAVHTHIHDVIEGIAPHDSVERFESLGVKVVKGRAQFINAHQVKVGNKTFNARYFVIATGSSAAIPSIPGLADVDYMTNENIFDLTRAPRHLVIIGGGPMGVEMAQAHRRLGSDVTLIEAQRLLPNCDHELAEIIAGNLRAEGTRLIENTLITQISRRKNQIIVHIADGKSVRDIEASHLLVATGRTPNIDELELDKANIAYQPGGIKVDDRLRTSNKRIYAIGDVIGGHQLTHAAGYHAGIVLRNTLFRFPAKADETAMPHVVYADPELAEVGMDEATARQHYAKLRVLKWPFQENDRARAERDTKGLVKVIVTPKGRIVGAGIAGKNAGDLLAPWVLSMQQGLPISAMAGLNAPYPTRGEASKRAAGAFYTPTLYGKWMQRLVRFISWFG